MKVALIDADSLVWIHAYLNRDKQSPDDLINTLDNHISEILVAVKATHYWGFVQGTRKSVRTKLFETYKANRPPAPVWLLRWKPVVLQHLVEYWKFEPIDGYESDDAVATLAAHYAKEKIDYVVVGNDKDLKQIPGEHYNLQKKEFSVVTEEQAGEALLTQLLTGDSTDNIKGLPGIGPVRAQKILNQPDTLLCGQPAVILQHYLVYHQLSLPIGLIDFAENVLKVTLNTKVPGLADLPATEVPQIIQQIVAEIDRNGLPDAQA